jgi:hypothetical protein
MSWDKVTLIILATSGCVTLLLTQISDVLSRLPQLIRAWREVRHELGRGSTTLGQEFVNPADSTPFEQENES